MLILFSFSYVIKPALGSLHKDNHFEYSAIDAKLLRESFEAKDVSEMHVFPSHKKFSQKSY